MMTGTKINTVAIFGAGAVGSYFIWGLSEKLGENLWIIADGERKVRYEQNGRCINGVHYPLHVRTPKEAAGVDLLLIASKYDALKEALDDLAVIVDDHTICLSLLNGVDSEEIVASRIGMDHMLYSMMQIASQRVEDQIRFLPERTPGLFYGIESPDEEPRKRHMVQAVEALLADTPIRYHSCEDIKKEIWLKMAFNVSMNLPQAIVGCPIGAFAVSDHMKQLRWSLRNEVCQIAAALGIDITELSAIEQMEHPSVPTAKYSTLQDLEAGRHTEIEMFAGTLRRLGREHQIPTPYCDFAYAAIRALEEKKDGKFSFSVL